ncbi:hypothetical protein ACFLZL_05150 [Thermodesulfobacteriota bacterium]
MLAMLIFLLILVSGIIGIILSIDFVDYLNKYQPVKWEEITFERPFGIPRQDFFFHPLKPHKFFLFIFSSEDLDDENVITCKKRLKITTIGFVIFLVVSILLRYFQ